jgi:uncharacterized phage protein gp47/JayE
MTITYGLTDAGFVRMRLPDIKQEWEDALKAQFGNGIDLGGDSMFGQFVGIGSEREALWWELMEAVYYSAFPDHATGVPLALACAIVGVTPLKEMFSTVDVAITGDPGTVLTAGRMASVDGTGAKFQTTADLTIGDGGTVTATLTAVDAGPIDAPPGTLTVIETPVAGWTAITNAAGATLGRNAEGDTALRQRRQKSLTIAKGGPAAAVEARLRLVDGVKFAGVKENRTNATVGGLPPKSQQAFVIGGEDADILQALHDSVSAGIETVGTTTGTVLDSFGVAQTYAFERGTEVPIYLVVNLTPGANYPADGDAQVKAALVAYGLALANDDDVINWKLARALPDLDLAAVTILQGKTPAPTTTTAIAIAPNEVATIDTANITVNHV